MRVRLWWLQPLPRTPLPTTCSHSGRPVPLQGGVPDAKPGMPAMQGGRGAAARRGRKGAGERRALFPGNTAGSELSRAVAWKDCSLWTLAQGASPQETPPMSGGRSPQGTEG